MEPEPVVELPELSVIAHAGARPLSVMVDPKAPAQPMPAQDGADVLRAIPGFNVIRKGGTDGDPVLRGMAGSRLAIVVDGETVLGGCGMRMDPPTAYVYPSALDRVTVLKGPQTVLHGAGGSAGVVLFERAPRRYDASAVEMSGSLTAGAFDRLDAALDVRGGDANGQFQLVATGSRSGDYEDGNGRAVASSFKRWNVQGALAWTPDERTIVELTGAQSDAEAAYADRAMDGVAFARDNLGLRLRRGLHSAMLRGIDAKIYYNYIDHVMDNYSLRQFVPTAMMPNPAVSNPDRKTMGARLQLSLEAADVLELEVGADYQYNRHTLRKTGNQNTMPYQNMARTEDAEFASIGLFAEGAWNFNAATRIVAGLRLDRHEAEDARATIAVGMASLPNPTAGQERDELLPSGFVRIERTMGADTTLHAGIGHTQRFPDYWELFNKESTTRISAFDTAPERTTQIDVGVNRSFEAVVVAMAAFASDIEDFILVESQYLKPAMGGTRAATVVRPVDARTWGGEASVLWRVNAHWRAEAALAYTRGDNRSDDLPLAQQPPLEARLSLRYERHTWAMGGLLRMVANQDRIAVNQGNIVGQDLGETPGFAVLSLNASWRPAPWHRLTVGVDNVFDTTYAEHLSRGGAQIAGFPPPSVRVNEPGRTWWLAWNFVY